MQILWYCIFILLLHSSCNSITTAEVVVGPSKQVTVGEKPQLNCTSRSNLDIYYCNKICNEPDNRRLPYSSTFCDHHSGSCVCDCRDVLKKKCLKTPFTPCFQECVTKNPNPEVFIYEGGNCPVVDKQGSISGNQCACECSERDDYIETNDVS